MEYIEREKALNADFKIRVDMFETRIRTAKKAVQTYANYIASIHAADVRPVVHGRWQNPEDAVCYQCSACGKYRNQEYGLNAPIFDKICPNCGAEMEDGNASD